MSVRRGMLIDHGNGALSFACPGCASTHTVYTGDRHQIVWGFNGNYEAPTFSPSISVRSGHYADFGKGKECWCSYEAKTGNAPPFKCGQCHCYVEGGFIRYLPDCTHELAGKTVKMLPASEIA